jgi:hypothetical protein
MFPGVGVLLLECGEETLELALEAEFDVPPPQFNSKNANRNTTGTRRQRKLIMCGNPYRTALSRMSDE